MRPLWLRDLLRRAEVDAELDEEIQFHLDARTDELIAGGLTAEAAHALARRELGGVEQTKEACRDTRGLNWLESLRADLIYGWRSLRHAPTFSLVAASSLAIGIGASSAIFSLADAALLRPLAVSQPDRLVELEAVFPDGHSQTNLESAVFGALRDQPEPFLDLFASVENSLRLRLGPGQSEPLRVLGVSGRYFSTLGTHPTLGRLLNDDDDRPGSEHVVVLSHSSWSRRFGGRADVVGQPIWLTGDGPQSMHGQAATIVGVGARDFVGVDRSFSPDIYMPLSAQATTTMLWIAGRLRPGVSIASAQARLAPLYLRALESIPIGRWPASERREFLGQEVRLLPAGRGTASLRWRLAQPLRVVTGAVLLVLAIACTNVAALQLSRGERRCPEIALRLALGAGRARIVRQVLTESVLLSLLGGVCGLAVAFVLHHLLVRLAPLDPTAVVGFRMNWPFFAVVLGLSTFAGFLTGLLPALRLSRIEPFAAVKGARGISARWRSTPRIAILVAQVAATLVLLAGAGLLLRSLGKLAQVDTGLGGKDVLLVHVDAGASHFRSRPAAEWGAQVRERVGSLPGIRSAALGAKDVFGGGWNTTVWVDGYTYAQGERQIVSFNEVGPSFFATVGIPLVAGRDFHPDDRVGTPAVAVVNRAFARKYFGYASAVGHRLRDSRTWYEIVGVVGDAKVTSLRETPQPVVYRSIEQQADSRTYPLVLHVRTPLSAAAVGPAIQHAVAEIDPELEVRRIEVLDDVVRATLQRERMLATVLSIFAGVTLLLTGVGSYGTMAYAAARRTAEIGVRMALGATERQILGWMLRDAGLVVATGTVIGLVVAALALRALRSVIFQVGPLDALSVSCAVLAVVVVGIGAALLPARSAARLAPMTALRHD